MAMFAGVLSRTEAAPAEAVVSSLVSALSRSGDTPEVHREGRLVLARIVPVPTEPTGLLHTPAGVTAAAGQPLLGGASATADFEDLASGLADGGIDRLAECRGQFAVAHWSPAAGRLVLATDFCGVRPLYLYEADDAVVFATALRLIEAVEALPLVTDLLGVTEQISFGYPLADRTPYANVRRLGCGEVSTFDAATSCRVAYAPLDDVAERAEPIQKLVDEAYQHFLDGIRIRAGESEPAVAFLSGGLDSRCAAGGLVAIGKPVTCVNLLRPGRLDTTLARRFAEALDLPLIEQVVPEDERQYVSKGLAFGRLCREGRLADVPALVFSGDGGSVGAGHDYLEHEHVRRMRAGDPAGAAVYAMKERGRPSRMAFRPAVHARLVRALEASIERELRAMDGPAEAGRKFHLFLMQNDQRRHLDHHFEELDRYRTEFATPFFDTAFVRTILSVPLDACMRHQFYYDWLERFPAPVREVPWQAYPGHLPCRVPLAEEDRRAQDQWGVSRAEARLRARNAYLTCRSSSLRGSLPTACGIGRARTLGVLALHALGVRNGFGLFKAANEYQHYLERTEGRFRPIEDSAGSGP